MKLKTVILHSAVFLIGGAAYYALELLYRGRSHPAMAFVGGACVLSLYRISVTRKKLSLPGQCLLGAAVITLIEFCSGCILNHWLGLGIWSYENQPGNILGQVCPAFTFIWFVLSIPVLSLFNLFSKKLILFPSRQTHRKH